MATAFICFSKDRLRWEAYHENELLCYNASNASYLRQLLLPGKYQKKRCTELDITEISDVIEHVNETPLAERFKLLRTAISIISNQKENYQSLIAVGPAGIGKSYVVTRELIANNIHSWSELSGYTSAKGLYEFLFKNQDQTCLLDDCDNALHDKGAVNLLKSALFSANGKRVVSWNISEKRLGDVPDRFEFTGKVIFLSNMKANVIPDSLISRNLCIDMTVTKEQVICYMWDLINMDCYGRGKPKEVVIECMNWITDNKDEGAINFRVLDKIILARLGTPDWREMASVFMKFGY